MKTSYVTLLCAVAVLMTGLFPGAAAEMPPTKKLIEYGWDVPTPEYIRDHIRDMEKRPFEGIIFRLRNGGLIFSNKPFNEAALAPEFAALQQIKWDKFTDNFVCTYSASTMDWFSDADWDVVAHNVGLMAKAARLGHCKGICFDAEPYSGGINPWYYAGQIHAKDRSFAEYEAMARKRGAQFMRAIIAEMPNAVIHTFFQLSYFARLAQDDDMADIQRQLSQQHYGLLPAFLNGMLDAAPPGVRITDGNEGSYYYTQPLQFFQAFHAMRQTVLRLIAPEDVAKYQTQFQVSNALYVDHLFNLRTLKNISAYMTPDERGKWFQQNVYYALLTSDEYVWCYSEKMNWWTNTGIPPELEASIRAAKEKLAKQQPLGYDMSEIFQTAQQRESRAIRTELKTRTATIQHLAKGVTPPRIDGSLDDAAWRTATELAPFVPYLGTKENPKAPTVAHVIYDRTNLYIAVHCDEPRVTAMNIVGSKHDDDIWNGDSIDIFLTTHAAGTPYVHFILNPKNVHWDARYDTTNDMSYDPAWTSATHIGKAEWVAEIAIPWKALGITPRRGMKLWTNICRQRIPDQEQTCWSQTLSGFMESEHFGTWVLK